MVKQHKFNGDEINMAITFIYAIEIANEQLGLMIEKGFIKQEEKQQANRFIKFWRNLTKNFWKIFQNDDEPETETLELINGLDNLQELLPHISRLRPEELCIVVDLTKRLLNNEFSTENCVYDFTEVYLGFKEHEIKEALLENLREVVEADLSEENSALRIMLWDIYSDVVWEDNMVYVLCKDSLYPLHEVFDDIELRDSLELNNYLYDKIQKRNNNFKLVSSLRKGNILYEFGTFSEFTEGVQNLQWRYSYRDGIPVYGKSPVRYTETKRRRYVQVNNEVIFLDELKIIAKTSKNKA